MSQDFDVTKKYSMLQPKRCYKKNNYVTKKNKTCYTKKYRRRKKVVIFVDIRKVHKNGAYSVFTA